MCHKCQKRSAVPVAFIAVLIVAALVGLVATTPEECRKSGEVPAYCAD